MVNRIIKWAVKIKILGNKSLSMEDYQDVLERFINSAGEQNNLKIPEEINTSPPIMKYKIILANHLIESCLVTEYLECLEEDGNTKIKINRKINNHI